MPVPPADVGTPREPFHVLAECASHQTNDELKPPAVQKTAADKAESKVVLLHAQKDSALLWKASSIHPMQPLQNVHQKLARDAIRAAKSDDAKQEAESATLQGFFYSDSAEPALMGYPDSKNPAPKFPEEELADAVKIVGVAKKLLKEPTPDLPKVKSTLEPAVKEMVRIVGLFGSTPDPATVPPLRDALQGLADADAALKTPKFTGVEAKAAIKALTAAGSGLDTAFVGLCSIQNMHTITPFYLFRMLVRFRIESDTPISTKDRMGTSGHLTGYLNNNPNETRGWLMDFLSGCIKELDAELKKLDADNLLFFLKGGRALKYLEDDARNGENDWDTQIVINPDLPVNEWYDLFRRVHNLCLALLKKFKMQFFMLMNKHAGTFDTTIKATLTGLNPLLAAPATRTETVGCKAELIDIGIPRLDTMEVHEQWHLMHGNVMVKLGVPLPNWMYYINEYVLMIREAYAEISISIKKTPKRVRRLYGIVSLPAIADVVTEERKLIPGNVPKVLPVIDAQNDQAKAVLTVLIRQLAQAYDLTWDPGLAAAFETLIDKEKADLGAKANYPKVLTDAIAEDGTTFKAHHKALADVVGFGQYVSGEFEKHLRKRGEFLWKRRPELGKLIKAIYTASIFKPETELELQFAVTGSFAAALYADYFQFPTDRLTEIEGVDVVEVKIYSKTKDTKPEVVRDIIRPLLEHYIGQPSAPNFDLVDGPDGSMFVFWPKEVDFEDGFKYLPRAIKISIEVEPKRWPNLGFVWGYPVVALRDLIREYDRKAAHHEEFGIQQRLKKTSAALVEILTTYENATSDKASVVGTLPTMTGVTPTLPPPTVGGTDAIITAINDGTCHYLMISSDQNANGPAAEYPTAWPPAEKYLIKVPAADNNWAIRGLKPQAPGNAPTDRTLDLLVINQGHGDIGVFEGLNAVAIESKIVKPLVDAGVTAHCIVLDFCLSATVVPSFAKLLAPGGKIICTLYSTNVIVMTRETWDLVNLALPGRSATICDDWLRSPMVTTTKENTGLVNIEPLRAAGTAGDDYVRDIARRNPGARDKASAARYLRQIAVVLNNNGAAHTVANLQLQTELLDIKGNAQIGAEDKAILAPVPALGTDFTDPLLAQVVTLFQTRLKDLLTKPAYNVKATLTGTEALFGPDTSLWSRVGANMSKILSGATGLDKLPSLFGVYDEATKKLSLDTALTQPLTPRITDFLNHIHPSSAAEVPKVNASVTTAGITLDPQPDFLHY